jgi:hypothetical protein
MSGPGEPRRGLTAYSLRLTNIVSWKRGEAPKTSTRTKGPLITTIDSSGILRIERSPKRDPSASGAHLYAHSPSSQSPMVTITFKASQHLDRGV